MSRRRGAERDFYMLRIVCLCGEPLGKVCKTGGRYLAPSPLEFRDLPEPTETSGKLVRRCPECGAEFQRRWDRLRAALDEMETRGVHFVQMGP